LGAHPILCGVVGADINAGHIIGIMDKLKLPLEGIIVDKDRPTTIKHRIIGNNQQIVRVDDESTANITGKTLELILEFVKDNLKNTDAVIISDYGKGVISRRLITELEQLLEDKLIIVDPQVKNFKFYKGVTCITPNHYEASAFCGFKIINEKSLNYAGKMILEKLKCKSVLITQGKDGMTLFRGNKSVHIDTYQMKHVFDVSGAGDTVVAVFTTLLAAGKSMEYALDIANMAGGIVVGEPGTSIITIDKLMRKINE
jgi:D-glycero-beta-D-manno-heptose-7-phosphate kinase